ncbi:hypothetical protein BU23DRAFT_562912 [Bimuria novae-zelandiae CBS 107.79]|uniref:IgE-binding protein n=1 Tax=Bimuria novae-zelandiae CBS 107.79 TaxID=1447943 RepID=A0A6A5VUU6_9PLEO|nr:hypothetical protein BU23DRAFT_562912 [Bimuria novae-zelandiae CBS 107.79]
MKSVAAFSALLASVLARPQGYETPAPAPGPAYFQVLSARSASPIHFRPLQANGGKFWLGGTPSGYCPVEVVGNATCEQYPGNQTTLAGGFGTLSLGVVVPGGQQVYIAPDGRMSYTTAHSAYVPEGSVRDGWSRTFREDPTDPLGSLAFEGGLIACPDPADQYNPWAVYGQTANFTAPSADCLVFSSITTNETDAGAWQY